MHNRRQEEEDDYKYFRTTCGLVGFIVFFLVAFLSFIVAEETGQYYEYTIIFGFGMLFATALFFCCVLHESKHVSNIPMQPSQWLPLDPLQPTQPEHPDETEPEPELEAECQQGPHWVDQTRHDLTYVRSILGLPPGDSENETDPETHQLQEMATSGLDVENSESKAISKESQDVDSTGFEDVESDVQLDVRKAGLSIIDKESSEVIQSGSDFLELKSMSSLSLSDTLKTTVACEEKETEKVSASLCNLSLKDSDEQAVKIPEEKSNEDSQVDTTSK